MEQGRISLLRVKGLMAPCGPMFRKQQELVENAGGEPGGSGCLGLDCQQAPSTSPSLRHERDGDECSEQVCTVCGKLEICRHQHRPVFTRRVSGMLHGMNQRG